MCYIFTKTWNEKRSFLNKKKLQMTQCEKNVATKTGVCISLLKATSSKLTLY